MEQNKIPTAEEFYESKDENFERLGEPDFVFRVMQGFAKLHVEQALKAASENAEIVNRPKFAGDYNPQVDEESILNSYSLNNIK